MVYVWGVDRNGWANSYYSAAVQAGQHDLGAFFFGSADWGNSITVDKPPLSLWVMGFSVRLFGLNPWAIMVPQAAMTVGSALLVFGLMRRCFPFAAALLSASVFAFTPITVLLARYNNPDPLMVLLMLSGLYAGVRATEAGKARFLYFAASLLALGFLAKQLQAFLVLPAIALIFLVYSAAAWRKRIMILLTAAAILAMTSFAWPLSVDLTPSGSRPYVGGSTTNSMVELTLGYNGLDRILQQEDAPSTALIPEELRSVATDAGWFRLFNANYGQEIGWLLVPGILAAIAVLVRLVRGGYNRNQSILALASAAWMLTTYFVLSFMGNSFHSYYTASLAVPLALCIGLGADLLARSGRTASSRIGLAAALIASSIFSHAMWQLSSVYPEWLSKTSFFLGLISAAVLSVPAPKWWIRRLASWVAIGALLVGPALCSAITMTTPQEGSNPMSGGLSRSPNTLSRFLHGVKLQSPAWAAGVAIGVDPSPGLSDLLRSAPPECTWAAATYPGQTAAGFQLEIRRPIMAVGGFAGVDPSPTLEQFQRWVAAGRVCYLVEQPEQLKIPGNSKELIAIQEWVVDTFRAEKIDGVTVYRLAS